MLEAHISLLAVCFLLRQVDLRTGAAIQGNECPGKHWETHWRIWYKVIHLLTDKKECRQTYQVSFECRITPTGTEDLLDECKTGTSFGEPAFLETILFI